MWTLGTVKRDQILFDSKTPSQGATLEIWDQNQVVHKLGKYFTVKGLDNVITVDTEAFEIVQQKEWLQVALANIDKSEVHFVRIEPGVFLKDSPLNIIYKTSVPTDFPNLKTYWAIKEQTEEVGPQNKTLHTLRMVSMPPMKYDDAQEPVADPQQSSNPYLSESVYLDFSHPLVQHHLSEIQKNLRPGMTRLEIVQVIFKYIPSVLKYDEQMTMVGDYKFDIKTSDILKRGRAVCQHFVNLFASFARALGVPARIIGGLRLEKTDSQVFHAWNEIEIRDGVWVPIDVLAPELKFDPNGYIPHLIQPYEKNSARGPWQKQFTDPRSIFEVTAVKPD